MQSLWDTQVQYSVTVGHTGTVLMQSQWDTEVQYSVTVGHTGTVLSHCGSQVPYRCSAHAVTVGQTGNNNNILD